MIDDWRLDKNYKQTNEFVTLTVLHRPFYSLQLCY